MVEFPIETAQLAFLTDAEIDKVVQGLLRIAAHIGIVEPPENSGVPLPASAFIQQEIRASNAGLWEPTGKLMETVEKGDVVGTVRSIPEFQTQFVCSPVSGVLIQYRHRELVATGTSLFSIGHPAEAILKSYI